MPEVKVKREMTTVDEEERKVLGNEGYYIGREDEDKEESFSHRDEETT